MTYVYIPIKMISLHLRSKAFSLYLRQAIDRQQMLDHEREVVILHCVSTFRRETVQQSFHIIERRETTLDSVAEVENQLWNIRNERLVCISFLEYACGA